MKALVIKEAYGPGNIALAEVEKPAPGLYDILVKVNAISLNQLDIMVATGVFGNKLPHILGSDAAGLVEETGSAVTAFKKGDRVVTHFIKDWNAGALTEQARDLRLGVGSEGVFAEYIVLPETAFVKIPAHLTYNEAATLPIAAVTAWQTLANATRVRAGETVLLQGTGGVSVFALQFAKAMGARVIITSSSEEKLHQAKALGADGVVNYKAVANWEDEVLLLTDGKGVDVALEISWKDIDKTIKTMGMGGRIGVVGLLGGTTTIINAADLIAKNITLKAIQTGSRDTFNAMNNAMEINAIHPVVDRVFPIASYKEAIGYLQEAKHFGKIVLTF